MDIAPEVRTVAVTRVDGGLTIMRFIVAEYQIDSATGERIAVRRPLTPERVEASIAKRYEPVPGKPNGIWNDTNGKRHVSWRLVPNDFVDPSLDRTYRNAWKDSGGDNPEHDMAKAREIQRVYLRRARLAEFCRLDDDYRRADEAGDLEAKKSIAAEKQKFRDVTDDPRIEAAQTVEELKTLNLRALVPETVGERYTDQMRVSSSVFDVITKP